MFRTRLKTRAERKTDVVISGAILIAFALFFLWYYEADSVTEHAAGTYSYRGHGQHVTLVLTSDQRFRETIDAAGHSLQAEGTWQTFGRGHIGFSKEFLTLSDQEICYGQESCGWLSSLFGYMTMDLGLNEPGLLFRKDLL